MAEIEDEKLAAMEAELAALRPMKESSATKEAEFVAKEAEWQKEKERLEQEAHPNWKKARDEMDALKRLAKEKGVEFNADGTPKTDDRINKADIIKEAQEATRKDMLNNRLDELLEGYTDEEAKVVRKQFEKLTAGEDLTFQNIRSFVKQAEGASGFEIKSSPAARTQGISGMGPRIVADENDKLDDTAAKEVAERMGIKINKK